MKMLTMITLAMCVGIFASDQASAEHDGCTTASLAGDWVFATEVGHQMLGGQFPPDKDVTAIGTMVIGRDGTLSGAFDLTVRDHLFYSGIPYIGTLVVNSDCTGLLTFATAAGTTRTDSIVIVGPREFLGMSQDPNNLWTYQARKTSSRRD